MISSSPPYSHNESCRCRSCLELAISRIANAFDMYTVHEAAAFRFAIRDILLDLGFQVRP